MAFLVKHLEETLIRKLTGLLGVLIICPFLLMPINATYGAWNNSALVISFPFSSSKYFSVVLEVIIYKYKEKALSLIGQTSLICCVKEWLLLFFISRLIISSKFCGILFFFAAMGDFTLIVNTPNCSS